MSRADETRRLFKAERGQGPRPRNETLPLSPDAVDDAGFANAALASVCTACGAQFSGDARFCPFDGEPLGPRRPWDPGSDRLLGSVVSGRYEILGVLGEGGMGRVYRARHGALGRSFALKVLKPELASDSGLAARFTLEAKAAASVSSPYVVQITDFGELETGEPFFVMELLEGCALSQVIRERGPLGATDILKIAKPVAEGLGAAHAAGIIHRDLKPDNVHVTGVEGDQPIVKVLDFGLAKVAGASRLTRDGMVFGTPHYMSPEQAAGEPLDHRVDVYSLGVVMYEMATGKTPFEADTYMGVLTQHLHIMPTRPSEVLGSDSLGALEDIILRCLAKRPSQRFDGMDELVRELRLLERGSEPSSVVPMRRIVQEGGRGVDAHGPPLAAALRDRETVPAPPQSSAFWRGVVGQRISGRALGTDDGTLLRSPFTWAVAGGSVVSLIALVYLLLIPWGGGPDTGVVDVARATASIVALSACPPPPVVPPTPGRGAEPERPKPQAPTAQEPADGAATSAALAAIGPMAAESPGRSAGYPRAAPPPAVASPRPPVGRSRLRRVAPVERPPAYTPPPPPPPPPPSRLPTLSGGDIIDPWAQ